MTSYSTAHDNIELLSKDEEGMSFQFIRESPGLEVMIKVLVKFITFRMTSGDKAPESALSSDEGSESDSLHRGRHSRRRIRVHSFLQFRPHRHLDLPAAQSAVLKRIPNLRNLVFGTSKVVRDPPHWSTMFRPVGPNTPHPLRDGRVMLDAAEVILE